MSTSLVMSSVGKRLRVLPVCHQLANENERLSQYFTPYPFATREEMEEPPAAVTEEVRELLQKSRHHWIGPKFVRSEIQPWKFRVQKRKMIAEGHDFPEKPMRDRMLDVMPLVQGRVLEKEDRVKRIEENMRMMPQWIAEHKAKCLQEKLAKVEQKKKMKNVRLEMGETGMHPKDPRLKELVLSSIRTKTNTKKFMKKKKKEEEKGK